MILKLSEIFFSIQGEGPLIGMPSLFFRLYDCNLSCSWCDTPYARPPHPFIEKNPEELISFWKENYPEIPYIVITGGEPLLQQETIPFLDRLIKEGAIPILETNGSLPIKKVPEEVLLVMDLKTPSSGMEKFNCYENLNYLKPQDALKFVIKNKDDFIWALNLVLERDLYKKIQIFFSPAWPYLEALTLAQYILETKLPIRLQIQLHKFLNLK